LVFEKVNKMARRVFFSFHYERDIWRANVVRNSWMTQPDRETAGYWDASLWEEAKKQGDLAIKRMINRGLENTSVTVVLIGAETANREWVRYEIQKSCERGNGLLGVHISSIKDNHGRVDAPGRNPFADLQVTQGFRSVNLSQLVPVYDWVQHVGYSQFGRWIEAAAKASGKAA
jgi:hypothetical protein